MALSQASPVSALRVLVVEDEPGLRFVIAEVFSSEAGFEVIEAASGDEAVESLKSHGHIDCVFTDVRMPGAVDGVALTEHVLLLYPDTKVVMASGNQRPFERVEDVPFFAKPYDVGAVARTIRQLVTA